MRHGTALRPYAVNIRISRERLLGRLLALVIGPVGIIGGEDIDVLAAVRQLVQRFLQPLMAHLADTRAGRAIQNDDVALAIQLVEQPFTHNIAELDRVRTHIAGKRALILYLGVKDNDRYTLVDRFPGNRVGGGRGARRDQQRIDAARHQVLNIGYLLGGIAARVRRIQGHARLLGRVFQLAHHLHAERVDHRDVGKADGVRPVLLELRGIHHALAHIRGFGLGVTRILIGLAARCLAAASAGGQGQHARQQQAQ